MFTLAKIRDGRTYLDSHLRANDYYCEDEQVEGKWVGDLAREWNLQEQLIGASDATFERLRQGLTPDGSEKLTQRGGGSVRFFDCQCSAEKSVSVMAVALGDHRLREAHERLSAEAFETALQRFAARRIRKGGAAWSEEHEVSGKMLAAAFVHDASRSNDPDPQLHTHFVAANVTVGKDGKRYALEPQVMCRAIRYAGKVYQAAMAREVRRLGYHTTDKLDSRGRKVGFEIAGVSPEIIQRFSKRRGDIAAASAEFILKHGREPTAAETHALALETRNPKLRDISTSEVRAKQLAQLLPAEKKQLEALRDGAMSCPSPARTRADEDACEQAVAESIAHLLDWNSVVDRHHLEAEALNAGLGDVDAPGIAKAVDNLARSGNLVSLGGDGLCGSFTTPEMLELEREAIGRVNRGRGGWGKLAEFVPSQSLSAEQNEATRSLLETEDQFVSLRGVAGTGKTTTLRHLNVCLRSSSKRVIYLAPTTSAVQQLKSELGCDAMTVSAYLASLEGKRRADNRGITLVVDEAGLKSLRHGISVLRAADDLHQRVILCGDTRQHEVQQSFLRLLERHSSLARTEITEIRRQKVAGYRDAVTMMAAGGASEGLEKLRSMGWVRSSGGEYLAESAAHFWKNTQSGENLEDCILVAPTWAECDALTLEVREKLRGSGRLGVSTRRKSVRSFAWTTAQRRKAGNYKAGMVVTGTRASRALKSGESALVVGVEGARITLSNGNDFDPCRAAGCIDVGQSRDIDVAAGERILVRQNLASAKLVNGDVLEVASISVTGEIKTKCGKIIPPDFIQLGYGYAVTSFRAQGRTAKHVVVAADKLDAKTAYVACSRGRESCIVCCPDAEKLISALGQGERPNVADVAAGRFSYEERRQRRVATRRVTLHRWASRVMRVASTTVGRTMRAGARFFKNAVGRSIRARRSRTDVQTAPVMPARLSRPIRVAVFSREGRGGI